MLQDLLRKKQDEIVRRWRALKLATYPAETRQFLEREPDRFANPVGHTIETGLASLYAELIGEQDPAAMRQGLDGIVRIRAVQELGAAPAVGFVLLLKDAVAEVLNPGSLSAADLTELREFDARIDRLLLLAFDLYVADREQVFQIRANELNARSAKLIERLDRK